jgi:lysophospholipase L1-like esterase
VAGGSDTGEEPGPAEALRRRPGRAARLGPLVVGALALLVCGAMTAAAIAWPRQPGYIRNGNYQRDPVTGHARGPNWSKTWDWPEHPRGKIEFRTNNLGLREDSDTEVAKPPGVRRILVTGDSHTEGSVYNSESWANRLEALLQEQAPPGVRYEVLNAASGHFAAQHYLAVFEKFERLHPDAFVIGFYTGNDFLEAIAFAERQGELETPKRPQGYDAIEGFKERDGSLYQAVGQAVNQIHFFHAFPALERTALELTEGAFREIEARARAAGVELVVVLLPTKLDVEWETDAERNEAMKAGLGLGDADVAVNRDLAVALERWLDGEGIPWVDVFDAMQAGTTEYYWMQDYHLNVAGHELVARELFAQQGPRLAGR